jgi:hypothetical protein
MKKGDIICKVKGGSSVGCWKVKREVYLLTSMLKRQLLVIMDEEGNTSKHLCIGIYSRNMDFVDASDNGQQLQYFSQNVEMDKGTVLPLS